MCDMRVHSRARWHAFRGAADSRQRFDSALDFCSGKRQQRNNNLPIRAAAIGAFALGLGRRQHLASSGTLPLANDGLRLDAHDLTAPLATGSQVVVELFDLRARAEQLREAAVGARGDGAEGETRGAEHESEKEDSELTVSKKCAKQTRALAFCVIWSSLA